MMLRVLPSASIGRALPTLARPVARAAAAVPSSPLLPAASSRLFSTTPVACLPPRLSSSAGSGQGGKKEKEAARKEKERAQKERERERAARDKERAQREKEKEKARKEKEKEKARKEKEKAKAQREKERERAHKEREKAKADKAKAPKVRRTSRLTPPKAPQTTWTIFFQDFLAERKASDPSQKISVAALTKEAKPVYDALSEEERQKLKDRAQEQREAYPALLEAWKATLTPEMIREENAVRAYRKKMGLSRKKPLKIEGEPKRPITGFMRFSNELRGQVDGEVLKGETDILKQSTLIAGAWRELTEEQKKVYNDAYAADRERYAKEKAEFDAAQKASSA
ncbi:hypothetical protein JCM10213_004950 [Rhodosporidiobolus nylandii]